MRYGFADLARETVFDPPGAAERVLTFEIGRNALWMALLLATVLNALLFSLSNYVFPSQMPFSPIFENPMLYAIAQGGGLVIMIFVLTWIGNMMGGSGQLGDVLRVMVWLQFMRVLAQLAIVFVGITLPMLGGIVSILILVLSLWILVHFINAAHRFGSLGRAFVVLLLAGLGISFGFSIILFVIGGAAVGITPNV
ncbi:Yip1 domain-containing protein [Lutimaribacter pacificus]|uniref:Yip1 domain-containing protein n=1 Tax=Lutimaribacter pacificus TaxID=391948 RepID=A0A1H0EU48_9RHOB|nr:Yip1 family protein [Lutimaribacter pacificus]SDN85908.1 Yip1 domain-containing protein [Lutimaribacter pacificus]SHK41263.1 Yip1 domain-containing protein [Lutimaribacter pacificus]